MLCTITHCKVLKKTILHAAQQECLPEYYITLDEAEAMGYKSYLGNLWKIATNSMLVKGIYRNNDGHLPTANNRIWYEADINYVWSYRGKDRILFSNDGLIFVTYDHYKTFIEII